MKTSKFAGVAVAGAATAAAVLLLGATAASAQPHVTASAYVLKTAGVLSISPTPYAESVDGNRDRESLTDIAALPQVGPARLSLSALVATAGGHAASADVARVALGSLLRADLIHTWCDGDEGGLDITNGTLLGRSITGPIPPQKLDLAPFATLELNARSTKGGSLTVQGVVLTVVPSNDDPNRRLTENEKQVGAGLAGLLGVPRDLVKDPLQKVGDILQILNPAGSGGVLTITIGSATCTSEGAPAADTPAADTPDAATPVAGIPAADTPAGGTPSEVTPAAVPAEHARPAPAPVVQEFSLPVTG